jgi:hypothetical protein
MRVMVLLLLALSTAMIVQAQSTEPIRDNKSAEPREEFELTAKLDYKSDSEYEVKTRIALGVPFIAVAQNRHGGIKLVSGMVQKETEGQYTIVISYFYGTSATENLSWSGNFKMQLDKPLEIGFCGGLCWSYTVKLSKPE